MNMCEVMNKAFNFSQDEKIFFFNFKPRFEMVKRLSAVLMVEIFLFRFQEIDVIEISPWMFRHGQIVNLLASLPQFSHSGQHSDTSSGLPAVEQNQLPDASSLLMDLLSLIMKSCRRTIQTYRTIVLIKANKGNVEALKQLNNTDM